jgi:hypothetical protein
MPKPSDYQMIRQWGTHHGSNNYYIMDQQYAAAEDDAPLNAIYKDTTGVWLTTDNITNCVTRDRLGLDPLPCCAPKEES